MNVVELQAWWDHCLTHVEREELMGTLGEALNPELALALWRGSRGVHVLEPDEWPTDTDPGGWRLTTRAADFVSEQRRRTAVRGRGWRRA